MKRRSILKASAGVLSLGTLPPLWAEAYPDHAIKILQGFAPGGNADNIARALGNEMGKSFNQSFVVEAQTGAGGTIAATTVARAKPDGYTLLLATGGHAVAGALYNSLAYKTVADFEMVSTITYFPFLIVTSAESKFKNLSDLLDAAKKAPESVSFGSAGIGSTHHLAGELLAKMAKVNLLHVPYRGDAASITALLANDVSCIVVPPTAVTSNIKAGKIRALATSGAQRWSGMPELATVAEQGVANYDVRSWAGLMAPAGTPKAIVERLSQEVNKALTVASVKSRLEDMEGDVKGSTPEEMKSMVSAELQKWIQVVADAKIPKQ